jgi:pyrroline-5-carboxylate reductase
MLKTKRIAFVGAGSMAEAMISGIVNTQKIPPKQIMVSNRTNNQRLQQLEKNYQINGVKQENVSFENIDIIVLAMKPKDAEIALKSIRNLLPSHSLILSVLAGIKTSFIEQMLPPGQQVIRVMPNTSSMIGESATGISPGKHVSQENLALAKEFLQCTGEVYILPEKNMDTFTGIAGSGPAYFYYLMEHMEKAGVEGGLSKESIRFIIAQTMVGAAKMILETGELPSVLRENVTSPNGTTAAGLAALDTYGGGIAVSEAIKKAADRSNELSLQFESAMTEQTQGL